MVADCERPHTPSYGPMSGKADSQDSAAVVSHERRYVRSPQSGLGQKARHLSVGRCCGGGRNHGCQPVQVEWQMLGSGTAENA